MFRWEDRLAFKLISLITFAVISRFFRLGYVQVTQKNYAE